jgi:glycosyltransferase involved in cell wall biosynthesis
MNNNILLSVIVPVYNVEKYLRKCLDSLVNQTMKDIEIIIVNDGSTDKSQDIIDEYVSRYPDMIRSYIKENGGLGDARNYGLERAKGEYVGFVDSDDWVSTEMFKKMYSMLQTGYDIVMCDMVTVIDGFETGEISKSYRRKNFNEKELILNSTNPAIACNKIYKKDLFNIIRFPSGWYEDIATTPIILSYADNVGYLEEPLYYYRQRKNSITASIDNKTLGVIGAWERILGNVNKKYIEEAVFAVAFSISAFITDKPAFADKFIDFALQHKQVIENNSYYIEAVKNNEILNITNLELIPKKIHYFWFGGSEKSELIQQCIKSWEKYAYDYEIIEWNETNCNINENQFVKEAYEAKKWAFVADYFRLKVIYDYGGFYLDTDTELFNRIDELRFHSACFAFETRNAVHAGIFGAVPKHKLIKKWLETYTNQHFLNNDGTYNTSETIVKRLTKILKTDYKIKLNGKMQLLKDNVKIYPPNVLTLDVYDGKNIAVHHYDASWWDIKDGTSYKNIVLRDYFTNRAIIWENYKEMKIAPIYRRLKNYFIKRNDWIGKIGERLLIFMIKLLKS